ncbi:heat stress transcription factor b-4 [Phtheirospermum japonicum]|uniref:Heat stress transcription factor b-4 n=1 Tax=Phtheirospermum japonicum TaxID=374723 RepID=A0A830CDE4_9LAMI|nr:heat stress transcription factor b-4 [Phtheirospermum japonicum]
MALMLDNCESILLSLDSHKSVPAPFLTKTYQLVDDPTTDHIVSWGEDDSTFVVWRPWEFANEYFKKGEKHLLCEIHRRKTSQPQASTHHHPSPDDNERLRRNNNMLMSELAHMKKLYNDIIYFVQNHVKPPASGSSMLQKPLNQFIGYQHRQNTAQNPSFTNGLFNINSSSSSSSPSSVTIVEEAPASGEQYCRTKLFGVPLASKKRLHPECNKSTVETNKTRLVLEKCDLGLNLMPRSPPY